MPEELHERCIPFPIPLLGVVEDDPHGVTLTRTHPADPMAHIDPISAASALHIIGCRAGWFTEFLGEDCDDDVKAYASWDEPGAPARPTRLCRPSTAPGSAWRGGVPPTCARPSPTTGTANTSTCRAPGCSGM